MNEMSEKYKKLWWGLTEDKCMTKTYVIPHIHTPPANNTMT